MALKLATTTRSGYAAEYYRIDNIVWNKANATANVVIGLYKDETTAKTAGSAVLEHSSARLENVVPGDNLIAACYILYKANNLQGSVDC